MSRILLISICLCGIFPDGNAQVTKPQPPARYLLDLQQGWLRGGAPQAVPFQEEERAPIELSYQFETPDSLTDSLFLYFEGLAWQAELYLNTQYLGLHQRPFEPWVISLHPDWLKPGENTLTLSLMGGFSKSWEPNPFLGIFRPCYLFTRTQLALHRDAAMPQVKSADTVALVFPYYRSFGYEFHAFEAARTLLALKQVEQSHVYFPLAPSRALQLAGKALGLKEVKSLRPESVVYLVNAYPFVAAQMQVSPRFWLDEAANRTAYYGDMYPWGAYPSRMPDPPGHQLWLALMMLLPLITLFLVKLMLPGFFSAQRELLFTPQLFIDTSADASFARPLLSGTLIVIKYLNVSVFIALYIWLIQQNHQWEAWYGFREGSLIRWVFDGMESLPQIWGTWLLVLGIWVVSRQILIRLLGRIFQIKSMPLNALALDVVSSYPLVWLIGLPVMLITLNAGGLGWATLALVGALFLFYLFRKWYTLWIGLNRIFSFSSAMKFLYICTFNVLPYVIWL